MSWVNGVDWNVDSELASIRRSVNEANNELNIAPLKRKSIFLMFQSVLPVLQVVWARCVRQVKNIAQHAFDDRWLYDGKAESKTESKAKNKAENKTESLMTCSKVDAQMSDITVASTTKSAVLMGYVVDRVVGNDFVRNVFESSIIEHQHYESNLPSFHTKGTITEVWSHSCAGMGDDSSGKPGADNAGLEASDRLNTLQTLLPALAGFCRDRWLVLIAPPRRPTIAALAAAGIDPSRVLIIHAQSAHDNREYGLQVVEAALRSGTCGAVVAWLETCDSNTMECLKKAAEVGHAWGVMIRGIRTDVVTQPATSTMFGKLPNKIPANSSNQSPNKVLGAKRCSVSKKPGLSIIQTQGRQKKPHIQPQIQHATDIWFDDSETAGNQTSSGVFFSDKPTQIEMAIS